MVVAWYFNYLQIKTAYKTCASTTICFEVYDLSTQVTVGITRSNRSRAATSGVANGRGGYTTRGSNAPFYNACLVERQPHRLNEQLTHERRLAQALEIDRAQRILEFRDVKKLSPKSRQTLSALRGQTRWSGWQWVASTPRMSMHPVRIDIYTDVIPTRFITFDGGVQASGRAVQMSRPESEDDHPKLIIVQCSMRLDFGTTSTAPCLHIATIPKPWLSA